MAIMTFDEVLSHAEALSEEEQEILADLLKKRRIEAWREETALYAHEAITAYRVGKLKSQSASAVTARLRKGITKFRK